MFLLENTDIAEEIETRLRATLGLLPEEDAEPESPDAPESAGACGIRGRAGRGSVLRFHPSSSRRRLNFNTTLQPGSSSGPSCSVRGFRPSRPATVARRRHRRMA